MLWFNFRGVFFVVFEVQGGFFDFKYKRKKNAAFWTHEFIRDIAFSYEKQGSVVLPLLAIF